MTGHRVAVYRAQNQISSDRSAARAAQRLTFGDESVYIGADDSAARAAGDERLADAVVESNLHLVTQVGNRFQAEHPDVPVLYAKGRYLLVDLAPDDAAARARSACYAVVPVTAPAVIYQQRPRQQRATARTSVSEILARISSTRLTEVIQMLVDLGTRESTSNSFRSAANGAREIFEEAGCAVRLEEVQLGSKRTLNVVADRAGSGASPRDVVIVTAHLDSVNHETPGGLAPGADDNGSGAAGVLEVARCLEGRAHTHDLRFILFGGEEQGLFGSMAYVANLPAAHRVSAVVNMDMIAHRNTGAPSVLIEGGPISQSLIDSFAAAADTYTGLAVQTSLHFFNSDHVPFINAGIPAVLLIEGNDSANTNVHTARDTMDRLDSSLMTEILRMNLATVIDLAGVS
jgi:hypothetical protein